MKLRTASWILIPLSLTISLVSGSHLTSEESARRSVRGREMILDNLRRFHGGLEPIPFVPFTKDNEDLPDDGFVFVADDLSCLNESNSLFSSCKYAEQLRERIVSKRLVEFSKYYLFEEHWLNKMMYSIINEHFPTNMCLQSKGIHDYVELMTLKYIQRDVERTPRDDNLISESGQSHIYHALMTFIHETVYGPGEIVPTNYHSWLRYVALKDKGFNLQLTFEYYYRLFGENEYISHLASLPKENPDQESNLDWRFGEVTPFITDFEWNSSGYLPEDKAFALLYSMGEAQIYSEHLLNRIPLTLKIEKCFNEECSRNIQGRLLNFLYRKFGLPLEEPFNCESYLDTRDLYDHPFDVQDLQTFSDFDPLNVFKLILAMDYSYLVKIDMLSKLIRSGLVRFVQFESLIVPSSLLQKLESEHRRLFDLVTAEYRNNMV